MQRTRSIFLVPVAFTVLVAVLSLGDGVQLPTGWWDFAGLDKLQHALAYATLAVSYAWAFRQNQVQVGWAWLSLALFALGAVLEVMQLAFYPQRYFETADLLANGLGAVAGALLFHRILTS